MAITKQRWNALNNKQKTIFQKEPAKIFGNGKYPDRNDIDIFIVNHKLDYLLDNNKSGPMRTDELWQEVVDYLNKNYGEGK